MRHSIGTAWKVQAVCLSLPWRGDGPAICPRVVIRGRLCLLEDLQMFPEVSKSTSAFELPWLPVGVTAGNASFVAVLGNVNNPL